jgi:hypothetical protein
LPVTLVLAVFFLPIALVQNINAVKGLWSHLELLRSNTSGAAKYVPVSGVLVARSQPVPDAAKIAAFRALPAHTRVFANNTYLLPKLAGRPELLLSMDQAYFNLEKSRFDALAAGLIEKGPQMIVMDDPDTLPKDAMYTLFQTRLAARISERYRVARKEHGWLILERV